MSDNPQAQVDFGYRSVSPQAKRGLVREVFDSVARRYDLMNDLMSLGLHRLWKRDLVEALGPRPNRTLLDLAGGTGDISRGWVRSGGGQVLLTDINFSMLSVGRERVIAEGLVSEVALAVADAEALPLPDKAIDRVAIAFGLRNCTNKDKVLKEARRVLRPGGKFCCLEFSRLQVAALEKPYDVWSFQALPRIGRIVAKDAASYQYLAESIRTFPDQEKLRAMMEAAGFERVSFRNLCGGIAAIHQGWRL